MAAGGGCADWRHLVGDRRAVRAWRGWLPAVELARPESGAGVARLAAGGGAGVDQRAVQVWCGWLPAVELWAAGPEGDTDVVRLSASVELWRRLEVVGMKLSRSNSGRLGALALGADLVPPPV